MNPTLTIKHEKFSKHQQGFALQLSASVNKLAVWRVFSVTHAIFFKPDTSDFTKISQPNGVTYNISNHTVRWEIF